MMPSPLHQILPTFPPLFAEFHISVGEYLLLLISKMDGRLLPLPAAGPPPPGVNSNFNDPIDRAPNLIACNVILLVVSTLIVGARVVSRTLLTDWRLGWDDCTCCSHDLIFYYDQVS